MIRISFPKNLLLKCWIFWIIVECTFKIYYELKSPTEFHTNFQELEDFVKDFINGLILPWFCGAIWSDFKFLSSGVIVVHIYIILVILFQIYSLIKNVRTWVWILFWLAMFTIWIEPWITLFTHKSPEALLSLTFLKEILFVADVIFSLLWLWLTYIISELLKKKFYKNIFMLY